MHLSLRARPRSGPSPAWRKSASSSIPSTNRVPGRAQEAFASTATSQTLGAKHRDRLSASAISCESGMDPGADIPPELAVAGLLDASGPIRLAWLWV
jgi:hypothetical protein